MHSINLSLNDNLDCKELWQIVTLCGVKELNLEGNDIGIDGLKHFKKLLQQRDLKVNLQTTPIWSAVK